MIKDIISTLVLLIIAIFLIFMDVQAHKTDRTCTYCGKSITNEEAYVASRDGSRYHIDCYKEVMYHGNEKEEGNR